MNAEAFPTTNAAESPLPLQDDRRYDRLVIGSHLILHGYGHWLPNDPRGSARTNCGKGNSPTWDPFIADESSHNLHGRS